MSARPARAPWEVMSHGQVAAALRLGADGDLGQEAGVELLIAHGTWLHRSAFRAAALSTVKDDADVLALDWDAALTHADTAPASGGEIAILRIAASLAGHNPGRSLRELLGGLDRANAAHVVRAVAHTTGLEYYRTSTTPPLAPAVLRPVVPGYPNGPASGPPAPGI